MEYIDVRSRGLCGDGKFDNTAVFNRLIEEVSRNPKPIHFPAGEWIFRSPPRPMGYGVTILGDYTAAPLPDRRSTTLVAAYNNGTFLHWDGSYANAHGAGGGIFGLTLEAQGTGVTAVKLSGGSDNFRAGWWNAIVLNITAYPPYLWHTGILIDGTGLNTPGAAGVRDVKLYGVDIFNCSDATLRAINATHLYWASGQMGAGSAPACNVYLEGRDIFMTNLNLQGNLTCQHIANSNISGKVSGTLTISSGSANSIFTIASGGTVNNLSSTVRVLS